MKKLSQIKMIKMPKVRMPKLNRFPKIKLRK